MWIQKEIRLTARSRGFHLVTDEIVSQLPALRECKIGLLHIFIKHTSASFTINENADPRVLDDLAAYLRALVPEEGVRPISGAGPLRPYRHDDEGADDMPAHIRTALTCTSLSLIVQAGRLALGTWQAVYLWEHRARSHRRRLSLHLIGA